MIQLCGNLNEGYIRSLLLFITACACACIITSKLKVKNKQMHKQPPVLLLGLVSLKDPHIPTLSVTRARVFSIVLKFHLSLAVASSHFPRLIICTCAVLLHTSPLISNYFHHPPNCSPDISIASYYFYFSSLLLQCIFKILSNGAS